MKICRVFLLFAVYLMPFCAFADDDMPTIDPKAVFETPEGDEESTSYSGSAPLVAHFTANPENTEGWKEYYEWRFSTEEESTPFLIRYEQDTDYTFTKAGTSKVVLYATFEKGNDKIEYTEEYWDDLGPITVTVSESRLDMPNAFSPNGDGINDVYKAKEGWQSLVEFHAYIFNRWGQKLYEWTDPADGWDGTYNGHDVAQGTYYVLVKAKGADGLKYNIRRDVNLLRGYNENRDSNVNP